MKKTIILLGTLLLLVTTVYSLEEGTEIFSLGVSPSINFLTTNFPKKPSPPVTIIFLSLSI